MYIILHTIEVAKIHPDEDNDSAQHRDITTMTHGTIHPPNRDNEKYKVHVIKVDNRWE